MSYEQTQQSVRTAVEAAKAAWTDYTLAVDYENGDVTSVVDPNPILMVDTIFLGGGQLDLGRTPLVEDSGHIYIAACVKIGAGTAKAVKLLDHVRTYLELKDNLLYGVRTNAAVRARPKTINGIYYLPMLIGFWTQRTAG